ncbi:thioesterase family protein [Rubinisphaera sp.]|uniref:acyl-CoA thioesterase n=1 Tax=Rubinisphaera sp. TaxID=2024857 RepID=UPI000C0F89E8|nr:thioesterase family protein [Rubinisphaera sp.]MBV08575.1 thioesterase [Rubinisphaera sp.]HCS55448.1 thioesterase [Planctomycetaceae bacterium]|tara:strand:+ start:432 stop:833 length:402 start_codon:yes stop_codon:yes gene_type:complete
MTAITSHTTRIRVRYSETDAMGFLHHGNYPAYFEEARTDLFRVNGGDYRAMEERGLFFVVVSMNFRFRNPARYDDFLDVTAKIEKVSAAKLEHSYRVMREETVIAEGSTVLALVDGQGVVQRITADLPGTATE